MADEDQVQELVDRLSSDSDLRDEFRESPADVVEQAGIELSDEQRDEARRRRIGPPSPTTS